MRYLVVLMALIAAAPAVAADGDPKKALTTKDQAAARAIVLKRSDLGQGFTATKRPADEPLPKGARCDALDEGDLTVTGDAQADQILKLLSPNVSMNFRRGGDWNT